MCSLHLVPENEISDATIQSVDTKVSPEISLNALSGNHSPTTLRFEGRLAGVKLQVLIDGGSTHSFVQSRIARHLKLPIEVTPYLTVAVGNGQKLVSEGCVRNAHFVIQGYTIVTNLYVLPLVGSDIVLGVSWLATLGPVIQDYKNLTMKFKIDGTDVLLRGMVENSLNPLPYTAVKRMASNGSFTALFSLTVGSEENSNKSTPKQIQDLLDDFQTVFSKPMGLAPSRSSEHAIHLQPGASPINVRPYRYPYFQKSLIEKLVSEMLADGVIQPSQSPFSSPVHLVKKKDGT